MSRKSAQLFMLKITENRKVYKHENNYYTVVYDAIKNKEFLIEHNSSDIFDVRVNLQLFSGYQIAAVTALVNGLQTTRKEGINLPVIRQCRVASNKQFRNFIKSHPEYFI